MIFLIFSSVSRWPSAFSQDPPAEHAPNPSPFSYLTLVFYAPTISGQAYFIWKFIFSSDSYGFANGWLMKLGATYSPILWFEDGAIAEA